MTITQYTLVDGDQIKRISQIRPIAKPNPVAKADYNKTDLMAILPDLIKRAYVACLPNVALYQLQTLTDSGLAERARFWRGEPSSEFDGRSLHQVQRGFLLEMLADELGQVVRNRTAAINLAAEVAIEAEKAAIAGIPPESDTSSRILTAVS